MANAFLRRVPAPAILQLELDPMEVEVLVVADEGTTAIEDISEEQKVEEAKRLRLLKWLVPTKGVARDRLDRAEAAAATDRARRMAANLPPPTVLPLGARFLPLQGFFRSQARRTGPPELADAIGGGRERGADIGHGFPRLLRPEDVAKISIALESVDRPLDAALVYSVLRIASFYREAAEAGDGILFFIC